MQLIIQSKGLHLPTKFENYVRQKIERLDRYLPGLEDIRLRISGQSTKEDSPKSIELMVHRKRTMLRAEENAIDVFAGFDLVLDKMYQRIARYKGRRVDKKRHGVLIDEELATAEALPVELPDEEVEQHVVRTKAFAMIPMNTDEAIEQMELLGHDFFVFMQAIGGHINVAYRRKMGGYGLLQPER